MKRILLMVLRNLLLVPWMWCRLCYHAAHPDKYSLEEHFKMLRFIVQWRTKAETSLWNPMEQKIFRSRTVL